jgi:hypothetical protein
MIADTNNAFYWEGIDTLLNNIQEMYLPTHWELPLLDLAGTEYPSLWYKIEPRLHKSPSKQ